MKNEAMSRAITGIDDELIMSAYSAAPSRRLNIKVLGVCAAACIAVICCITIALRSGGPEISVYGQDITKNTVVIAPDGPDGTSTRQYEGDGICIPISLKTKTDLTIKVSYGELDVTSGNSESAEDDSGILNVSGSADIVWSIESPDKDKAYELQINGGERVYGLSYDTVSGKWQISKK